LARGSASHAQTYHWAPNPLISKSLFRMFLNDKNLL